MFSAGFEQTALLIYKVVMFVRSIFSVGHVTHRGEPAIYNITTMKPYLQQLGKEQAYSKVFGEEKVKVFGPQFYPDSQETALVTRPEIYYSVLDSVTVVGGCNVIVCDDDVALYEEFEKADIHRRKFESVLTPYVSRNKLILDSTDSSQEIEKGISLCGLGCENLYHWLFEYIARLKILEFADPEYSSWPILVDEGLCKTPQLIEILELYTPHKKFIYVKYGHRVNVSKLLHLSLLLWIPFNFKQGEICEVEDCIISPPAIQFIRSKVKSAATCGSFKRIFISRKKFPDRRRINEDEVFKVLSPLGFAVIYPEDHTFIEQMAIFRDAEIIVGVTGAALSNIVFCDSGTLIICLTSAKVQLGIFSNIASYLELDLIYLAEDGDLTFKDIHRDFDIDPVVLKKILLSVIERSD